MARLYRLHPDSSYLTSPRVFARVFCDVGTLPDTVRFYGALTSLTLDMDIPEAGLHVVAVGPFLILEMDEQKLDRAGQAAQTQVTVLNPDLEHRPSIDDVDQPGQTFRCIRCLPTASVNKKDSAADLDQATHRGDGGSAALAVLLSCVDELSKADRLRSTIASRGPSSMC